MRVRRRGQLVCRWDSEGFYIGLPGPRRWVQAQADLLELLRLASDWVDADELAERVGGEFADQARAATKTLLEVGILVATDDDDVLPPVWQHWGTSTERFHLDSRDADYLINEPERDDVVAEIVAEGPPPAAFKEYPAQPRIFLPRLPMPLRTPVEDVFAARRTHRVFDARPVSLDALATVLLYTFAPVRFLDGGAFGAQQARVSASAGGRHEAECYVAAYNIDGVPPGLYHYSPRLHALELLDDTVDRQRVARVVYEQEASYSGAFTLLTTAVASRLSWKYRSPRAYRLWMYDAGHYGQTFSLTCTALGLAPFQTIAFHDSTVETLLGVDPDEEFAVYLLAAGHPVEPGILPADFSYPAPERLGVADAVAADPAATPSEPDISR